MRNNLKVIVGKKETAEQLTPDEQEHRLVEDAQLQPNPTIFLVMREKTSFLKRLHRP